jgi:assimilatory nitrate reductase catalytic subunit
MPCDITGITGYGMIDELGGIQWPLPTGHSVEKQSQRRLFENGAFYTDSGKAKLCYDDPRPAAELTDDAHPFTLLTGRGSSSQWHTQTRTGKSDVLKALYPSDPYVEICRAGRFRRAGLGCSPWEILVKN